MPAPSKTGSATAVEREERDRAEKADAEALAERLRGMKLEVAVKAGEKNRLFGSVTNREIAELIAKEGIEVDRHAIHLREPIKTVGDYRGRRAADAPVSRSGHGDVVQPRSAARASGPMDLRAARRMGQHMEERLAGEGHRGHRRACTAIDVVFSTQPFRTPHLRRAGVREYVSQAFDEEDGPRVWVGDPVVDARSRGDRMVGGRYRERRRDDAGGDVGPALRRGRPGGRAARYLEPGRWPARAARQLGPLAATGNLSRPRR